MSLQDVKSALFTGRLVIAAQGGREKVRSIATCITRLRYRRSLVWLAQCIATNHSSSAMESCAGRKRVDTPTEAVISLLEEEDANFDAFEVERVVRGAEVHNSTWRLYQSTQHVQLVLIDVEGPQRGCCESRWRGSKDRQNMSKSCWKASRLGFRAEFIKQHEKASE